MIVRLFQRETFLLLIALIAATSAHKQNPNEYEAESVSHIDFEHDQMAVEVSPDSPSNKVKRTALPSNAPPSHESKSVRQTHFENNQSPAEDRNWQVIPKTKRMTRGGKKVHIYLKNDDSKSAKYKKPQHSTSTASSSSKPVDGGFSTVTETQTRRTPELTTKADRDTGIRYTDKEQILTKSASKDSFSDGSEHFDHVVKEKIKIKHHHHHHHHNHVKTVVKKEPYPVEKVVHVPVEKIVEKKVHYKVEVPVDRIIEKVIHVPKPYPYKVEVPYEKIVHVPFEKIVEKVIKVPYDR